MSEADPKAPVASARFRAGQRSVWRDVVAQSQDRASLTAI